MAPVAPSTHPELFEFHGSISFEMLCAYLSRAVTYNNALGTAFPDDDLRMLTELEACFLGRAAYVWQLTPDDDQHFAEARAFTERLHAHAPHIICQAGVFEAVYPGVNDIAIPTWVFEDLSEDVETRNFRYEDMFEADFARAYHWSKFGEGCQVPDFTLPETRRWFYYRCCRYIDAGYEAIHLGQPHLYAAKDENYRLFAGLLGRVRSYAKQHARRGIVLLDAHTHGIVLDGHLLFDFHSRPMSARNLADSPYRLVLQYKGANLGGISPSGWACESLPYIMEVDNWGGWSVPPEDWHDMSKRIRDGRWGWDDISWLAHQDEEARNNFVNYAYRWLELHDPVGFFQYPARRLLAEFPVTRNDYHGQKTSMHVYHANQASEACPWGFSQEHAIGHAWQQADPVWLSEYHQPIKTDAHNPTRQVAEPVMLIGSLQQMLGGIPGESMDPFSRFKHLGDGIYGLATVIPYAGTYNFAVAVGGTMTEVYRQGSLNGNPAYVLTANEPNLTVLIRFDVNTHVVSALDEQGNQLKIEAS
ncbi:MAG: hypothetical protein AAF708_01920 [Deinococcota bacterium]